MEKLLPMVFLAAFHILCVSGRPGFQFAVPPAPTPGLFLFGDSSLDVGTDIYLRSSGPAGRLPYGRDFFHHPTGRFSNGRNLADFIAQHLGIPSPLPFLNPSCNASIGVNFASAGSGILDKTGEASRVYSLGIQVEQFSKVRHSFLNTEFHHFLGRSLFVLSAGANDIVETIESSTLVRPLYLENMVLGMGNAIQNLYNNGARKFLVFLPGPVGCYPSVLARRSPPGDLTTEKACSQTVNELALDYNTGMEHKLKKLTSANPNMNVVVFRAYSVITSIITTGTYGFDHGAVACCGGGRFNAQTACGVLDPRYALHICPDASSYFFWDSVHPTEAAAELLVKLAWDGPPPLAAPFNVSTLLAIPPPLF